MRLVQPLQVLKMIVHIGLTIHVIASHNIEQAREIIKRYGHNKSIRTLDAIQLSTSLGRADNLVFVCADTLLTELAQNEK